MKDFLGRLLGIAVLIVFIVLWYMRTTNVMPNGYGW